MFVNDRRNVLSRSLPLPYIPGLNPSFALARSGMAGVRPLRAVEQSESVCDTPPLSGAADVGEPHSGNTAVQRPIQFSLRTGLLSVAGMCAVLALIAQTQPGVAMSVLWLAALVAAHIAGNVWGHRETLARRIHRESDDPPVPARRDVAWDQLPPATRLRRQAPLGKSMSLVTFACAAIGGVVGTALLTLGKLGKTGWEGVALGGASATILGGFVGFLASSFLQIAGAAFKEAETATRSRSNEVKMPDSSHSENLAQPDWPELPIPTDEVA